MSIFDLIFILAVLGSIFALFLLLFFLLHRQWVRVRQVALALISFFVLYTIILLGVSGLSPQKKLAMHQDRCFDDWCISAEKAVKQAAIGTSPATIVAARGEFYIVSVRASSRAKGITQRALDVQIYLLTNNNQHYDPSPTGQKALDKLGQGGQALSSQLGPGGTFTRTVVFDLPQNAQHIALVVTHGLFPGLIIIGDEQSFLHKPTIVDLQISA